MSPQAPPTAEQREVRIAGLRARRFARLRWLALRAVLLAGVLVLLGGLALYWLVTTVGGRDVLLAQVVARLPAGTTLAWQRAEGPAAGPLTLHGVRFSMPRQRDPDCVPTAAASCATGRITFSAATVVVDPALRPLLGRRLRLDALDVRDATLVLPESDTPFKFPRWPDVLPDIAPPLALQADRIRIDGLRVRRGGEPLVDLRRVRGGLVAEPGALHVEHLVVDSNRGRFAAHGDYAPGDDYRSDLVATAVFPAPPGRTPARLGLVARGDLASMVVALAGAAPAPLRATLTLAGTQRPHWTLRAQGDAFDPGLLAGTPGTPVSFALDADGTGGVATLRGHVARDGLAATLQPSHVALADQVLTLQPLVVEAFDGRGTLRGTLDLRDPSRGRVQLGLQARGLQWGARAGTTPLRADADLGVAGTLDQWAVAGNATLRRGREQAALRLDGNGTRTQFALHSLQATMPQGRLDATGTLRWSPRPAWQAQARLAGFDPGYFLPGWDGAIDGQLDGQGTQDAQGRAQAQVAVPRLGGRLRGRPLQGNGQFALEDGAFGGRLSLALGRSRVEARGHLDGALALDARFAPLHLDDLLPRAGGTLTGTLHLAGPRDAPDIDAQLRGSALSYAGYRVGALDAHGRLPWRRGSGTLVVDARDLVAGIALEHAHVAARGAVEALQLDASAAGAAGTLATAASLARRNGHWQGTLAQLQLAPAQAGRWTLQAPARFAQSGSGWQLAHGCLRGSEGGTLCVQADWPRRGIALDGSGLPLALATPWLPPRDNGRPWGLHGEIALQGQLRPAGQAWRGDLRLTSPAGGLRRGARARRDVVAYAGLSLDARFDSRRVDAKLGADLDGGGRVDARVATGWDAYAPLDGTLALRTDALAWMELLSPDIVDPTGTLDARLRLGGTRAAPTLGGQAHLARFSTELPALAIVLEDGDMRLDALPDGSARLHGTLRSGDGTLALDGTLGWRDPAAPLQLAVRGRNVLAADTRDLRAVIDPDVQVRYAGGQPLAVTGTVGVPSARIALERLDRGVAASPDVVVLDPAKPGPADVATPVALDLTLALGKDVRLEGYGLTGTLAGSLHVSSAPGREMTATG
ncbi:MAG: translocation/assembly module TamB domain-containing protein, partial [Lysobacteraceae bacterium]